MPINEEQRAMAELISISTAVLVNKEFAFMNPWFDWKRISDTDSEQLLYLKDAY